jgi:MYXO-CTERM domain-containing protein
MKGMLLLSALLFSPQSGAVTIWPATATPGTVDSADTGAVELGVKFQSDVDGAVLGIRFYKSAANTGTHIGNLWDLAGTNLAQVAFSGETASGWQQMNFANPVPITASTVYVASYYCPAGHYSDNQTYFSTAYDNAPLHALADGTQGGNGVFLYGASSAFPNQTYHASNYWVDIVFSPASSPPPPPPPPPASGPPATSSGPRTGGSDHKPCGCGTAPAPSGLGLGVGAVLFLFLARSRRPECP